MATRPLLLLLLWAASGGLACSEPTPYELDVEEVRVYAEARCAAAELCCEQSVPVECSESIVEAVRGFGLTVDAELIYSADCVEELVEYAKNITCDPEDQGWEGCRLAVGKGTHGDPCEAYSDAVGFHMTTCRQDLQCRAGYCVDDPFIAVNHGRLGEQCSPFAPCDTELFCAEDGLCAERPGMDQRCTQERSCERELYCAGLADANEGTCQQQHKLGDPCDDRYGLQCGREDVADSGSVPTFCVEGACWFIDSPVCEAL